MRLGLVIATAIVMTVLCASVRAQQPSYNYFSRTPESEKVLQSNELHHLHKGISNLRIGKPAELEYAKGEFDFILGYWPNHLPVLALQAEVLRKTNRSSMLDGYFGRAYQMSPSVAQLHILHGVELMEVNRLDDAIARLKHAVSLDDQSMNAHYYLGLALMRAKRLEEANREAQRAYELGHEMPKLRELLQKAGAWKPVPAATPDGTAKVRE